MFFLSDIQCNQVQKLLHIFGIFISRFFSICQFSYRNNSRFVKTYLSSLIFLWHSIYVKDKVYLRYFSSKKVEYQNLILMGFISKKTEFSMNLRIKPIFEEKLCQNLSLTLYGVSQKRLACSGKMLVYTICVFFEAKGMILLILIIFFCFAQHVHVIFIEIYYRV